MSITPAGAGPAPAPAGAPVPGPTERRHGNGFRYSDRFLRIWTAVLGSIIVVCPILGIVLLSSSDSVDPHPVGLALLVGGVAIPFLAAAVLGGNAIRRGGGWVGLIFFLGFAGVTVGPMLGVVWLGPVAAWLIAAAGGALLLLGGFGFYYIGWKATVPIWIQAPSFGSPRLYVRGAPTAGNGGDPTRDATLPNALDGRHKG